MIKLMRSYNMLINKKLKDKVILVTGGAGFIGSNLCEFLLKCKSKVICLDNLSTGFFNNIESLIDDPNFTFINGDIRKIETCQDACKGVDFVLHQAAIGSVPRSIKNPIYSNDVNVSGFLNMLVAAKDQSVRRFIFAASSSTYGDSQDLPKVENNIGNPMSPYAITKYVNELYARIFNEVYGMNYIGLRYFNVYGRRQDPNGAYAAVIPLFVKQLISGNSPNINGDGSFSRDYTYIDNVIQMNILCMLTEDEKALNQIYNTAVGKRTTLIELVDLLKNALSSFNKNISKIAPTFGPSRKGDVPHSLASIQKSKNLLNYNPSTDLLKDMKNAVNWYCENLI